MRENKSKIDLKKVTQLYTIDVTANVLFGFNPRSLDGVTDELHEALYSTTKLTFKRSLEFFSMFFMPFLLKVFGLKGLGEQYTSFIFKTVPRIFEQREKSGQKRGDFIDLLLELKNNGELLENEIIPQVGAFFFAGKLI
jgi:cytochrome P450 family 6